MITVDNIKILNKLKNHEEGEKALVMENGRVYVFNGESWEYSKDNSKMKMSLYELNKMAIGQMKSLEDNVLDEKLKKVEAFIEKTNNTFYMLLSHENKYYTLFHRDSRHKLPLIQELKDVLVGLGSVKSVEVDEDKNLIEIWVNDYAMLMFPYDFGVIDCR